MAWEETRDGKPTGRFLGRVRELDKTPPLKCGPRAFKTMKEAKRYEEHCKLFGEEPPRFLDASEVTFRDAHDAAKAVGGPHGRWLSGNDRSGERRRNYVVGLLGDWDVAKCDQSAYEVVIKDLMKRGDSNSTINRYLFEVSGILTHAQQRGWITEKPKVPKRPTTELCRKLSVGPCPCERVREDC